ncbi:hypothetical protein [Schaalia cardiffensis]|uniref:hypothetical protein n=1 Tax=Schaalia cardiffensis TaxID=181487 RepID=UPI0023F2BBE9|nr:hypothetical protein [Schaalia cardiffensis]
MKKSTASAELNKLRASLRGQARFIAYVASRLRADIASVEGAHGLGWAEFSLGSSALFTVE